MIKTSTSEYPPATTDLHLHIEAFGVVVDIALPAIKLPRLAVRSRNDHYEIMRAL